tara:strand:- start:630 stop:1367 length:738 start_codon:yes stop_codon:yes gene_type:complete
MLKAETSLRETPMNAPLMPKATAVWLVDNTALSFEQIADFCGLHALEVQAIADDEVAIGMQGQDPIANGQVLREEINRCEDDAAARLELLASDTPMPEARAKGPRYTPLSKRQEKPDAIAWLLRHYPELSDAQVGRMIGTTKPTINAIRDRTHWNAPNLRPRSPVEIGLCSMEELEENLELARKRAARKAEREQKALAKKSHGLNDSESEINDKANTNETGDAVLSVWPAAAKNPSSSTEDKTSS